MRLRRVEGELWRRFQGKEEVGEFPLARNIGERYFRDWEYVFKEEGFYEEDRHDAS